MTIDEVLHAERLDVLLTLKPAVFHTDVSELLGGAKHDVPDHDRHLTCRIE
jgi:hypothetical protein